MSEESTLAVRGKTQNGADLSAWMRERRRIDEEWLKEVYLDKVGRGVASWEDFLAVLDALVEKQTPANPSTFNKVEIPGLPPAPMTPIRDMVCAIRVEQKKVGSIYLPDDAIQSQICRVLSVGPGLMLDDGVIREAPCKRGDVVFTTPGDGFLIKLDGEEFWIFEAMEVVAILEDENMTGYGTETCLNE